MWKYISGVSKVVDGKKNEKVPKAARDTKGIPGWGSGGGGGGGKLMGERKVVRARAF